MSETTKAPQHPSTPDRIEKTVILNAPRERVWSAIQDSTHFGRWFGAEIDGAFTPGARLDAKIRPTLVDPEVAKMQQELDGTPFVIVVEDVEPPRRLSFRWHPYAPESEYPDVQEEPMTLVTFTLEAASADPERTRLTIVESGFHALPDGRRAEAYESNEGGWEHQTRMIGQYLKQGLDRAEA